MYFTPILQLYTARKKTCITFFRKECKIPKSIQFSFLLISLYQKQTLQQGPQMSARQHRLGENNCVVIHGKVCFFLSMDYFFYGFIFLTVSFVCYFLFFDADLRTIQ